MPSSLSFRPKVKIIIWLHFCCTVKLSHILEEKSSSSRNLRMSNTVYHEVPSHVHKLLPHWWRYWLAKIARIVYFLVSVDSSWFQLADVVASYQRCLKTCSTMYWKTAIESKASGNCNFFNTHQMNKQSYRRHYWLWEGLWSAHISSCLKDSNTKNWICLD
jgi:hypothetical protein